MMSLPAMTNQSVLPSSSVGEESLSLIIQILPADFDAGTSLALNI